MQPTGPTAPTSPTGPKRPKGPNEPANLAMAIEHTLLKPDAIQKDIENLCQEALDHSFFGVCLNSSWLPLAKNYLRGSKVKLVAVVGFPLGVCNTKTKNFEAKWCVDQGADEIDMVIHLGLLKKSSEREIIDDINQVCIAAQRPVKVILETGLLEPNEIIRACGYVAKTQSRFVKTSTGFLGPGATAAAVQLMKKTIQDLVGDQILVKASGGIKNRAQALEMIEAGASRLGTSRSVAIVQDKSSTADSY